MEVASEATLHFSSSRSLWQRFVSSKWQKLPTLQYRATIHCARRPFMATDDETRRLSQIPEALPTETSQWLPCHYFDYMAGTSTGGLISIMLGRLRMNIDDCIADYEKLGGEVFAHSRWFHLRSPFWFPREKYNHRVLEQVVQDVVARRVPKIGGFPGGKTFAFDENRCRV